MAKKFFKTKPIKIFFKKQKKYILFFLILALFILLMVFIYVLYKKNFSKNSPSVLQAADGLGSFLLSPSTVTIQANDTIDLTVTLDTGGEDASGVDVLLAYSPDNFNVNNIVINRTTSLKTFAPVTDTDLNAFDWQKAVKEDQSVIAFGASAFDLDPNGDDDFADAVPTLPFNGNTDLATITFQVKDNPTRRDVYKSIFLRAEKDPADGSEATNDSNIIQVTADNVEDIIGYAGATDLKIITLPECRAAVTLDDQTVGLNDILLILDKYNSSCTDCFEDLNDPLNRGDGAIGLADLLYVLEEWGETCPASE